MSLYDDLRKKYGENSVMYAKDIPAYETVSSGSISLDYATGIGGFPTNRVIEIAGKPGSGKTTISLHAVNNFLKKFPSKLALYIDIENRLTPDWLSSFVEDTDRVIVVKPDTAEEATDIYNTSVSSGQVCVVVFDSIGGAPSQRVTNKSATIGDMGGNSQAISRFSRSAQTMSGKYNCCTIGINQVRDDFGGYNRFITPGGNAWKHATSLRIELKQSNREIVEEEINGEKMRVGYQITAKIHKNSLGPPFRQCLYWFYNVKSSYGFGVDQTDEIVRLGLLTGVIEKLNQSSFTHPLIGKVTGRQNMIDRIKGDPIVLDTIRKEILESLGKGGVEGVTESFIPEEEEDGPKRIVREYGD